MSRVRITEESKLSWIYSLSRARPVEGDSHTDGGRGARVRIREQGSDTSPQLVEVEYPPNSQVPIHAHDEDEIIFVREGEMIVGTKTLHVGDSIFIAGSTLYSFKSGDHGLTILNFRPRKDETFITREDFQRRGIKADDTP